MEKNKILGSQDNTKIVRILEVKESLIPYLLLIDTKNKNIAFENR